MRRSCDACGASYEAKTAKSRYCGMPECTTKRNRDRKRGTVAPVVPIIQPPDVQGTVAASTRRTLEAADRLDHPAGAAALILAARLDLGSDSGSAMAAMTRELRAAVAEATKDVAPVGDQVDELRQRRRQRLASS